MSLAPNQQLFEYRIVRPLGQGAFGTVYLAHDTLLDRPVAIKELTITAQADEIAFQRFLQEARAAGNLNHPHVVTVHALKITDPNVYMVMEYLPGGSLRALLEQRGPLPVEEAVRIAANVCEGLAAAHSKGIIHRDVKPENILLAEEGQAKIGDFGIAHVPRASGGATLTQAGFQPGTLIYMSPEQIRGQSVDGRSDVYQVGAILYEILTGRHYIDIEALEQQAREASGTNAVLFQARTYELLAKAVCEWEPMGVCQVRTEVPGQVGQAVAAALTKEIAQRPQAGGLAQMLVAWASARAQLHYDVGVAYAQVGRLADAIREYQAALRINPSSANAHDVHYNLGVAYCRQGYLDNAIHEFQAALRINPNSADAHHNLGSAYADQGRLEDAIHEYQAALHIDPDGVETHYNLGVAYYRQGYLDNAILEFQAALRINPDFAEAHYLLGEVYMKMDRQMPLEDIIHEYEIAAQLGFEPAREMLSKLNLA